MDSVNAQDNEWFDDLEESLENNSIEKSERVRSQMETLDRKKVSRDAIARSPQARQRPNGLVESMMKCVITDSTLEHGIRNYQVALTPRTERRYQSPLLSGRRVISQIPRAAVSNSPLHSPRRARGGHERVRVYASPARLPHNKQVILQSKLVDNKEQSSRVRENAPPRNISEDEYLLLSHPGSPLVTKRLSNNTSTQPSDKEVIVKKGLLWLQQDKFFSRWKERFVVLTSHYLQLFKKTSSRISEMGTFMLKVKLSDLSSVSLEDRRGYLTLVVSCQKEGRLVIRKTEGIREWHDCLNMFLTRSTDDTEERKMDSTEQFWDRAVKEDVVRIRDKIGNPYSCMTPPRSSTLLKKSPAISSTSYFSSSSPLPYRSSEDDSGLESMKTNTSDSGSSAQILEDENHTDPNHCAIDKAGIYQKSDQTRNDPEKSKKVKEKHERGVSMAEYTKFRAKLPLITP